ncbi:pectate lyase-like [Cynara cardunculus var. scolymus]|uniref:pectate lyase-like n=1 Tax=Cynara cardunculus var. scolymus TaxID=59895 RepID=UPI000D6276CD|nr:pectate lyase-like [Cynara cardunculus var. scolymus]
MTKRNTNSMPFFVLVFVIIVPAVLAGTMRQSSCNDAQLDGFMQERAHNATRAAIKAYNPHPESAVIRFSKEVHESLLETNSTRRNLGGRGGGGGRGHAHGRGHGRGACMATNPIDRCWRCNRNWAKDRQALAKCARGFGEHTIGGMRGRIYVVTDSSDLDVVTPKKGTLRYAVIQDEPLWIIFETSMVIQLKEELMINNDKTIDGRGANVQIAYGAGLTMQFVHNIIVHGIHIHHIVPKKGGMVRDSLAHFGLRTASDGDGISIFGASKVWVDHVSLDHCADGLIDAIMASTALTISNCKFNYHNDVMLLGANDQFTGDEIMQVTVAFNRFGKGLVQRMPRCRWGFFHVVNNDYNKWEMYAIGGSMNPTIISQGNRFRASDNVHAKEVTHRDHFPFKMWKNWRWRTVNDLFLNGAFFVPSGDHSEVAKELKTHMVQAKDGSAVGRLTRYAGMLLCNHDKPC